MNGPIILLGRWPFLLKHKLPMQSGNSCSCITQKRRATARSRGNSCWWHLFLGSVRGIIWFIALYLNFTASTASDCNDRNRARLITCRDKTKGRILREYDQWIMVCSGQFSEAQGRLAELSDIARLDEYQHLYNKERSVNETPDWVSLIQQQKLLCLKQINKSFLLCV